MSCRIYPAKRGQEGEHKNEIGYSYAACLLPSTLKR